MGKFIGMANNKAANSWNHVANQQHEQNKRQPVSITLVGKPESTNPTLTAMEQLFRKLRAEERLAEAYKVGRAIAKMRKSL